MGEAKMAIDTTDDDVPDLSVAKEFYAKYELQEVLGKGVSSTVRRCLEKESKREYAVKIIDLTGDKNGDYATDEIRLSTHKEMNILRMCTGHPHIIELHDTFESSTFIFLVFEICEKGELFDYLTQVVTLSEKRTRIIMRQLLEAVAFVHSHKIVHRDLKPENILLDNELNVKLSDFGFATVISHQEELVELCGTPGYLAPEVLRVSMYEDTEGYGMPVDMWAIGVIMYTLLVGCPPFWHRKQMYMLRAIMEGNYKFGSPEWDDISEAPKDLISKLLVVDPNLRLTAKEALAHPFFSLEEECIGQLPLSLHEKPEAYLKIIRQERIFNPRRTFKAAVLTVIASFAFRELYSRTPVIDVQTLRTEPYRIKVLRKIIDGGAFKIYGHWVKKGENQNRAALFENMPKRDRKNMER